MTTAIFNSSFAAPVAPAQTRLRLTRRGRAVVATAVAVPLFAIAAVFGLNANSAAAGDADAQTGTVQYVTVQSGESLWQLAEQIAPNKDPRDVIADIEKLNALDSANVPAGVSLAVPSY